MPLSGKCQFDKKKLLNRFLNVNYFKFQIAVFSGSVECGLASFPDIYVRLEEKETLEFVREFAPGGNKERVVTQNENDLNGFESSN